MIENPCRVWRGLALAAVCCASFVPVHAQQASPPDPKIGRELALSICASCHVVAPDQERLPQYDSSAPPFILIANRQNTSVNSLRTFLRTTHRTIQKPHTMPDLMLGEVQIDNLVAYILTLRIPERSGR